MKFEPEELNTARQNLLNNISEYFLVKKGIEALYIQGSLAANTADKFSDIDFRVVVNDKLYEQVFLERFSAPQHWGEFIYNEWSENSVACVSHFRPFNKVDVLYFKPEQIKPSPWFSLPIQIICDRDNLIGKIIQDSQKLNFITDTKTLNWIISKGLANAEEAYRRVMREELIYAQSLLASFRANIMQLDDFLGNKVFTYVPSPHFEQRGSQTVINILNQSYSTIDQQATIKALKLLLDIYRQLIVQVNQVSDLPRDQTTDLNWIDTLIKLCNVQLS